MHLRAWLAIAVVSSVPATIHATPKKGEPKAPKDSKEPAVADRAGKAGKPATESKTATEGDATTTTQPSEGEEATGEPISAQNTQTEPNTNPIVTPPPPATTTDMGPKPKFTWEPFGFLRMQYRFVQNDPNVIFVGRDDGFELQNARFGVRGLLDDRAAFTISLDGAVDERIKLNTPDGKLRVGLRDAFVDIGVGGKTIVRGGFFRPWVDPESLIDDTAREFVDHPIESRGVRATEGYQAAGLTPGRSIGAAFRYDHAPGREAEPGVAVELALQNGADEFSSSNDNDKPAISASVLGRWGKAGESFVVASARYNPRTVNEIPALQDENDLQGTFGIHVVAGAVSFGAAAVVINTSYPTTNGPTNTAIGGHGQIMFTVPASYPVGLGYRFGILDASSLIVTDRVMEHTLGMVIGVPRLRMRVQAQFVYAAEQAARALDNSRAQLAVEVAL